MSKHTPKPWDVGPTFDNDGEPEIIIEHKTPAGNLVVAVALAGLQGQANNASLIASAPELLDALKQCLEMLEHADCSTGYCCCGSPVEGHGIGDGHGPVDQGDYYQCSAMDAASAAIAKAEAT